MKVRYKREMRRNYLIIEALEESTDCFEIRMLSGNSIEGLLKFRIKQEEQNQSYYYEITSKQPLSRILELKEIRKEELGRLMIGIGSALNHMEDYLLKESHVLLEPEYIYIEPETYQVWLCYVPGYEGNFPAAMEKLLQYLLKKADHRDNETVVLAYRLFQESQKDYYGIEDLLKAVQESQRSVCLAEDFQVSGQKNFENEFVPEGCGNAVLDDTVDGREPGWRNENLEAYGPAEAALADPNENRYFPGKMQGNYQTNNLESSQRKSQGKSRQNGRDKSRRKSQEKSQMNNQSNGQIEKISGSQIKSPAKNRIENHRNNQTDAAKRNPGKHRQKLQKGEIISGIILAVILAAVPAAVWLIFGSAGVRFYSQKIAAAELGIAAGFLLFLIQRRKKTASSALFSDQNLQAEWFMDLDDEEERAEADQMGMRIQKGNSDPEIDKMRKPEMQGENTVSSVKSKTNPYPVESGGNTVLLASADSSPGTHHLLKSLDPAVEDIPILYVPFLIGKQNGIVDYVLERDTVSRLHIRIDEEDGACRITDLNSSNGTTVAGRSLEANESCLISSGDKLQIADVAFVFY